MGNLSGTLPTRIGSPTRITNLKKNKSCLVVVEDPVSGLVNQPHHPGHPDHLARYLQGHQHHHPHPCSNPVEAECYPVSDPPSPKEWLSVLVLPSHTGSRCCCWFHEWRWRTSGRSSRTDWLRRPISSTSYANVLF